MFTSNVCPYTCVHVPTCIERVAHLLGRIWKHQVQIKWWSHSNCKSTLHLATLTAAQNQKLNDSGLFLPMYQVNTKWINKTKNCLDLGPYPKKNLVSKGFTKFRSGTTVWRYAQTIDITNLLLSTFHFMATWCIDKKLTKSFFCFDFFAFMHS